MYLSRQQVRQVDKLAVEQFSIPSIVLMENASRGVADVAETIVERGRVLVLCGGGNNGGDGFAAARHLHNRGWQVSIQSTTEMARYAGDALVNLNIVQAMGLTIGPIGSFGGADLIIDAIFGTGLSAAPRSPFAEIAKQIEAARTPVLAVDLPSGMDCDTGVPFGACVRAFRTVTFVAQKLGFANPASREFTGAVVVADIGAPRELIASVASGV